MQKDGGTKKDIKRITNDISKSAKKDKQNHLIEQFNENPSDENKKYLWKSVKDLKKKLLVDSLRQKDLGYYTEDG